METLTSIRNRFAELVDSLKSSLDDICWMLKYKGVTVPDGTKLSDVPGLISSQISEGASEGRLFRITCSGGSEYIEGRDYNAPLVYMFYNRTNITSMTVQSSNTSDAKMVSGSYMFYGCSKLAAIEFVGDFGENINDAGSMFSGCKNLVTISGDFNMRCSVDLSETSLDSTSIGVVVNGLATLPSGTTDVVLTLGDLCSKMTAAQKSVVASKNWRLA